MSGDREARIRELLPVVRFIARRVHRMVPSSELEDLIGDGCVGLIRAVDAFDPTRGIPLEQYARRLILGAVLNGVRRMDPVTERMRRTLRIAEHARFALAQEIGTLPPRCTKGEPRELVYARTEAHRRTALSLDCSLPRNEKLEPDRGADPQVIVGGRIERERMRRALAELPPRERTIVVAHYFGEQPLRAMVGALKISPQRVSQLHLLALERLRAELAVS